MITEQCKDFARESKLFYQNHERLTKSCAVLFVILICFPTTQVLGEDEGDQVEERLGLTVRKEKIKEYVGNLGGWRLSFVQAKIEKNHKVRAVATAQISDIEIAPRRC